MKVGAGIIDSDITVFCKSEFLCKKRYIMPLIYPIQVLLQEKEKRHPIPEDRNKAQAVAFSPSECRIMVPGVKECILNTRIKGVKGEKIILVDARRQGTVLCLLDEKLFFYCSFHRPHTDKCISFDLAEMFMLCRENA